MCFQRKICIFFIKCTGCSAKVCVSVFKFTTAQLLVSKKLRLEKYRLSNCDLFSTLSIQPMVKPRGKVKIEFNYYNIMSNIL